MQFNFCSWVFSSLKGDGNSLFIVPANALGTALWQPHGKPWCCWDQGGPSADPSSGLTSEPGDPAPESLQGC